VKCRFNVVKFWSFIEQRPGPAWVDQWAELLGEEFPLVRSKLLREVPYHPTEFDTSKGRRAKITSANGKREWRIIPKKKLVRLEIDWHRLGNAVARAFDLENKYLTLDLHQTWQIGDFASGALPVFLTVQGSCRDFRGVVAELAARYSSSNPKIPRPFVVVAPTTKFFDASIAALLDRHGATFFDLESNLKLSATGEFQTRESGKKWFIQLLPGQADQPSVVQTEQVSGLVKDLAPAGNGNGLSRKQTKTAGSLLLNMGAGAKHLGVSRTTLWRMIRAGQIQKVEVLPGSYRVRRDELEAIAAAMERSS
jgi:excisionase family DNA binding protein